MQIKSAKLDTSPMLRGPLKASSGNEAEKAPAGATGQDDGATVSAAAEGPIGPLSGDAGQRIGHFVRGMAHESLQHVRYLAGASAFRNIGSTIGSLAFTPLAIKLAADNAAIVGGVAIGGTVALGALGGLLGYLWVRGHDDSADGEQRKKSVFGKAADVGLDVAAGLDALPKFIYPSVYGASEAQRQVIYNALDQLPLEDATASATMTVIPNLVDTGISGMSQPGASHVRILLDQSYLNDAIRGRDLVFHENGHAVDYSGGFGLLGSNNWHGHFGHGPFVSEYASSNRYEDWADTYQHWHKDPAATAALVPGKAEVIARVNEQSPLNRAADTPRVRSAGKRIGEALGSVPYLRDGVELAASLVGPVQIYRGAGDLLKGLETEDPALRLKGKFNLASGLFLTLPGAAPLALASSIAGGVIKTVAKEDKEEGLKTVNTWADAILSTSAGPVGMTLAAVQGELKANGLRYDDRHGFSSDGWKAARATKANVLKGTVFTVGGAVGGSLAGAAIGATLAGRTGAAIGGVWGQLAGGAIGLGLYGAQRALKEDRRSKNPLALTGSDKKFLVGTVGGALLGGALGTGLGTYAGKAFGQVVGSMIAGQAGGALGATVFGWGAALAGAYGGARLGAATGSGRLFGRKLHDLPTATLARPEVLFKQIQLQKEAENARFLAPEPDEEKAPEVVAQAGAPASTEARQA
jgi:hypothetical protein